MFGRTNNRSTRTSAGAAPGTAAPTHTTRGYGLTHHLLRILQLLSALVSLILFSVRLAKIVRLVGKASRSNGAVEGIVAAAVLYTLIVMALSLGLRASGSNLLRILFIVFDVLFAGAFIAVAVLTSPKRHGSSGPCTSNVDVNGFVNRYGKGDVNCNLPWGTFVLAIVSTLLHAITAAFHGAKDHRRTKRDERVLRKEGQYDGRDGFVDDGASGYTQGRAMRV
ncbi:hypothetical protein L207DRAFT_581623 [Hyaloscypha variabilis F]|uniref:MARVEL domain-containing protein n=1 Tax=Hyaloscypha variabilis (strain UAMH 11265 / GT02V1 / F) TaxID=1149755 RepID=A0A2J6RRN7_HYAVF|nr:hypothetical protein L207DRAFT_581623 [Hyaloscypha variabilis F]